MWGLSPKNFRGQKHAKFGPILDDFEVRRRISPKRMKIFKIGLGGFVQRFLPRWVKKVRWTFVHQSQRLIVNEIVPIQIGLYLTPVQRCNTYLLTTRRVPRYPLRYLVGYLGNELPDNGSLVYVSGMTSTLTRTKCLLYPQNGYINKRTNIAGITA